MTLKKYSTLKAKLDRVFSIYIRTRDANAQGLVKCCTCDNIASIKEIHCGHFISRRYLSTRWDELNCAGQCAGCNMFKNGEQYKFGVYIDEINGKGMAKRLGIVSHAKMKYSRSDLSEMIKFYENKLKEL